jgi:hypothetical protein
MIVMKSVDSFVVASKKRFRVQKNETPAELFHPDEISVAFRGYFQLEDLDEQHALQPRPLDTVN